MNVCSIEEMNGNCKLNYHDTINCDSEINGLDKINDPCIINFQSYIIYVVKWKTMVRLVVVMK